MLHTARERPDDEIMLSNLAKAALDEGGEDAALPLLRRAAARVQSARLWQWTGLLERSLEQHQRALASFERAVALAPTDESIAHARARIALEAGVPAERLFETALRISPRNFDVLRGYFAALFANGKADLAESSLDSVLARVPLWIEGHAQLAQIRSMMGRRKHAAASLERALALQPRQEELWTALFGQLIGAEAFVELDEAVSRARQHLRSEQILARYEVAAAVELGDTDRADHLFASLRTEFRQAVEIWRLRHLLRTGRIKDACAAVDAALRTDIARHVWPYASIVWRLVADPRWEWLEGDFDRTVSVIDLTTELPDMHALERVLRDLHAGRGEFLDQSVRGGSQTDGPLFTRIDPEIRTLRAAIVKAVERHVESLPPADPAHPLLAPRRDRNVRFSGSWSVLLRGGGYHTNHVHPEGWISSALYIRLPEKSATEPMMAGWLTLGEPQSSLGVPLKALREIEPRSGRLVLFPSYTWHGTRPFENGERLTVAFDVRQPI